MYKTKKYKSRKNKKYKSRKNKKYNSRTKKIAIKNNIPFYVEKTYNNVAVLPDKQQMMREFFRQRYKQEGGSKIDLLILAVRGLLKNTRNFNIHKTNFNNYFRVPRIKDPERKIIDGVDVLNDLTNNHEGLIKINYHREKNNKNPQFSPNIKKKSEESYDLQKPETSNNNSLSSLYKLATSMPKKDHEIKLSVLASEKWMDNTFTLVNGVNDGLEKNRNNKKIIIEMIDKLELYNRECSTITKTNKTKCSSIDKQLEEYLEKDAVKTYNITKNEEDNKYYYEIDIKEIKKKSTITYNLFKNLDISFEEIKKAYCDNWTKDICEGSESFEEILYSQLRETIKITIKSISDPPTSASPSLSIENHPNIDYKKMVYGNMFFTNKNIDIPYKNIKVNANSLGRVIYSALSGIWDNNYLNNILGIIQPIVIEIFEDIKNSDENGIDIIVMIAACVLKKEESEVIDILEKHPILLSIKQDLNSFIKANASIFSEEFTKQQFVGFTEEFVRTIKVNLTDLFNERLSNIITNIDKTLQKLIEMHSEPGDYTDEDFYDILEEKLKNKNTNNLDYLNSHRYRIRFP
jgi:hypothetical protein